MRPASRADIKILQKQMGFKKINEALVLAPKNDPFNAGTSTDIKRAEWFRDIWDRFGFGAGVHLRRIHYKILSYPDVNHWDGTPYENTEKSWEQLGICSLKARYLRYVDPGAFRDHRNPDPVINIEISEDEKAPGWWVDEELISWTVPSIDTDFSGDLAYMDIPYPVVTGYEYGPTDQAYHIEVWIEKSTMNDILVPLCERWGINYVTSIGFQSISSVIGMIQRIRDTEKPGRIFYISDFDPAGDRMPSAVARQVEYWITEYAPGADIALHPVALTRDQVRTYNLPRTPLKDSDARKGVFEEQYGAGAVELDALEALYPGALARIIETTISPFFDTGLPDRLRDAECEARDRLHDGWDNFMSPYRDELQAVRSDVAAVVSRYQERIDHLSTQMASELEPYQERLNSIRHAVLHQAREYVISLPRRPDPDPVGDVTDYLFSSHRSYLDQLAAFKRRYIIDPEPVDPEEVIA